MAGGGRQGHHANRESLPDPCRRNARKMRNTRQNLFWVASKMSLILVAAGALYPRAGTLLPPMLAAGAMALSSVFVFGYALRLRAAVPSLPAELSGA